MSEVLRGSCPVIPTEVEAGPSSIEEELEELISKAPDAGILLGSARAGVPSRPQPTVSMGTSSIEEKE